MSPTNERHRDRAKKNGQSDPRDGGSIDELGPVGRAIDAPLVTGEVGDLASKIAGRQSQDDDHREDPTHRFYPGRAPGGSSLVLNVLDLHTSARIARISDSGTSGHNTQSPIFVSKLKANLPADAFLSRLIDAISISMSLNTTDVVGSPAESKH